MSRLLWVFAWTGVAVWTLFAFAAYGLVDLFGGLAARHADQVSDSPETVEWLSWFFRTMRGLGTTLILIVWGTVSAAMLSVPWMVGRLFTTVPDPRPNLSRAPPPPPPMRRDGVIDLDPADYDVVPPGPPASPTSGSVPRIDSRR